jgi:hypothetical protein
MAQEGVVGFLEQLRQSADELLHWAGEAGKVGVARVEELAARRRVDALLRELGALAYAEQTGGGTPDPTEVARLVAAVQEAEGRAEAAARHAQEVARAATDGRP